MDDLELKLYATLGKASVDFPKREVVIPFKVGLSSVDLNALAEFSDITLELSIRSQTLPLDAKKPETESDLPAVTEEQWAKVTGNAKTTPADPQAPAALHHALQLTAFPTHDLKKKRVENVLKALWGVKIGEARVRTESLPVFVLDKANLELVLETKAKLESHGALCEIIDWTAETLAPVLPRYQVSRTESGVEVGIYAAATPEDALDLAAKAEGLEGYADLLTKFEGVTWTATEIQTGPEANPVADLTHALADAINAATEGPLADVTAKVEPQDKPFTCMEATDDNKPCPHEAKWRTNPEKAIGGGDGIWCDAHKQEDDVPMAEARLVVGVDVANGSDRSVETVQPALFPGAPPPPTDAELAARDAAWEGEPGDHRSDEALVG